jgi:hypothetical protein
MTAIGRRTLLASAPALALACTRGDPPVGRCEDTHAPTPEDAKMRVALGYTDASTHPGKACAACVQYLRPKLAFACGHCKLLKGPVRPTGYCNAWSAAY